MGARSSDQIMADRHTELLESAHELVHGLGCDCSDPVECLSARRDQVCNAATAYVVELAAWQADQREGRVPYPPRLESPPLTPEQAERFRAEIEAAQQKLKP